MAVIQGRVSIDSFVVAALGVTAVASGGAGRLVLLLQACASSQCSAAAACSALLGGVLRVTTTACFQPWAWNSLATLH